MGNIGEASVHEFAVCLLVVTSFLSVPVQATAGCPPEQGSTPRLLDRYGDPLPEGAVARLGSVRLRHAQLKAFALLADGQTAVTVGHDQMVRRWDLGTGRQTRAIKLQPDSSRWNELALSPDGTTGATFDHFDKAGKLVVWDAASGRAARTLTGPAGFVDCMTFSPDSSVLAVGTAGRQLTLIEWQTGRQQGIQLSDAPEVRHRPFLRVSFSWDGRRLVVGGVSGKGGVYVFDTATLRQVFSRPGHPDAEALSADGTRLAVCRLTDEDWKKESVLRLFDLGANQEVARYDVDLDRTCLSLAFSPDGKTLACIGYSRGCLLDAATGRVRHPLPGQLWQVTFSPDGQALAAQYGPQLRLWDVATGREQQDRPGSFEVGALAVSPDGLLLAAEDVAAGTIGLWGTVDGRPVRTLSIPENNHCSLTLAFSADGETLAHSQSGGLLRSWKVATGAGGQPSRLVVQLGDQDAPTEGYDIQLSSDGRRVSAVVPTAGSKVMHLVIWDVATAKVVHRHGLAPGAERNIFNYSAFWSPTGSWVALSEEDRLILVDPDTGRTGVRIPTQHPYFFSADGRLLAAEERDKWGNGRDAVRVWEVASGREVAVIATGPVGSLALGASRRALITADQQFVRVFDLATGKERGRRALPELGSGYVTGSPVSQLLVFPGDGKVLTTLADGTALIWDLTAFAPGRLAERHGEPELKGWWADLAGEDAGRAYAAVWRLSEGPTDLVVPFLRERLRPAQAPDLAEVRRLVADLDSQSFAAREAASKRLEQMGSWVVPALREALEATESAEVQRRAELLLARLSEPIPAPEVLRTLRAIAVLERVGSRDARQLVEDLASGAAQALESIEAKATLARMTRLQAKP